MGEQEAVLGRRRAGLEVCEEGFLRTEHLNGARGQLGQACASACAHGEPSRQYRSHEEAEAWKVLFGQGPQGGLQPVKACLNVHGSRAVIPQAAPLGARWHVKGGVQVETTGESTQIVRLTKRSRDADSVLVQVKVGEEQAKPLNKPRKAHVACLTHFFHRAMEVLQTAVQIPGCIGHTTFRKTDGCLIEEGQVLCAHLGQLAHANRLDGCLGEALEQLRCFGGQPTLSHTLEPLNGPLHATASRPPKAIDFDVVLVDEDRDKPIMKEAHVATNRP
jgi:hypothetical protein